MDVRLLKEKYHRVRGKTNQICESLVNEDYSVQPLEFVSPPKWHLAHSTWFFEQFVLVPFQESYEVFNTDFAYLFNSYYNNIGKRVERPNRGLMTRPTVDQVFEYRFHVDQHITTFLDKNSTEEILKRIELGLHHEQQHQELLYYDIKYILGHQSTFPIIENTIQLSEIKNKSEFIIIDEGLYHIGHKGETFCYDNELGNHKVYLNNFEISNQLITNSEYIEFIESGAYKNFNLWHAEGWNFIQNNSVKAPLYWHKIDNVWCRYTLNGLQRINKNQAVMHVSFYEAAAFAEWKNMRLPTEFEWETASNKLNYGQLWEWTNSAYLPYPKFKKPSGALGEYNGKFMINQMVLRGASVATPNDHSRKTYRNFFHPEMRWLFSGIRLVK